MGDNICGCCLREQRDLLAVVVFVGAPPGQVAGLVKLCTLCRHTHWSRVARPGVFGCHVYERTSDCDQRERVAFVCGTCGEEVTGGIGCLLPSDHRCPARRG